MASWLLLAGLVSLLVTTTAGADETEPGDEDVQAERGGELYQRWCATCHATDGSGTPDGPPIDEVTIAYMDLTMRTGRMPLADPERGVRDREFTAAEREAVLAYTTEVFDLADPIDEVGEGDPARGREVYSIHCAQCHGASGDGGIAGDGTVVPKVAGLDPVTIAQATREGPFQMPGFSARLISDQEIADMAAFLDEETFAPNSPLGIHELNKVQAALFSLLLVGGVVGVGVWAGRAGARAPDDEERSTRRTGPPPEGDS